jgi:hypothetical protein
MGYAPDLKHEELPLLARAYERPRGGVIVPILDDHLPIHHQPIERIHELGTRSEGLGEEGALCLCVLRSPRSPERTSPPRCRAAARAPYGIPVLQQPEAQGLFLPPTGSPQPLPFSSVLATGCCQAANRRATPPIYSQQYSVASIGTDSPEPPMDSHYVGDKCRREGPRPTRSPLGK